MKPSTHTHACSRVPAPSACGLPRIYLLWSFKMLGIKLFTLSICKTPSRLGTDTMLFDHQCLATGRRRILLSQISVSDVYKRARGASAAVLILSIRCDHNICCDEFAHCTMSMLVLQFCLYISLIFDIYLADCRRCHSEQVFALVWLHDR